MSEVNPPLVLEGGSHDSDLLRQLWGDTYTAGIVAADHLEVTEQSTPALGVTVAAGRAFVAGDEASDQGVYYVSNDAGVDVALATADASNDRIDLIVARVLDSFYSGASDEWELQAVTGTPAASPTAPTAPSNSLILAEVTVPADAGGNPAITDSEIEDKRVQAHTAGVAPGGTLAYAEVTSNQDFGATSSDITGLSVTVDVPANRRIRITGHGNSIDIGGTGRRTVEVHEDSTVLGRIHDAQGSRADFDGSVIVTPSEGEHTYNLHYDVLGGDDHRLEAASTAPAFILAEDIGLA